MSWFTLDEAKLLAKMEAEVESLRAKTKVSLNAQLAQAKADAATLEAKINALFPPAK